MTKSHGLGGACLKLVKSKRKDRNEKNHKGEGGWDHVLFYVKPSEIAILSKYTKITRGERVGMSWWS